ncbi:MAG: cytochrome P450 [Alphaproteobacteria bacterium]
MEFDLSRAEVRADPYPLMSRLRAEDPVHWSGRLGGWLLTRYADVRAALNDQRLSADRITPFADHVSGVDGSPLAELAKALGLWAVFRDPPDHTRLRAAMNRAFLPGAVLRLTPAIEALVDGFIDRAAAKGTMDVIGDFAYPLPVAVIGKLLGVPAADFARLKAWSDDLATVVGTSFGLPDKHERAARSWGAMRDYFASLIETRRSSPPADALGDMIRAREVGAQLDDAELVANAVLLLFAGHETTTNLIANAVLALIRNPRELARLKAEPELAESAVEEFLRYDGPVQALTRIARVDVEIGGQRIGTGERLVLMLTGANRDPAQFRDPDRLDLAREPNRHIAFGYGIHFCLGAPLARLEARIALSRLVARLPELALAEAPLEWLDSLVFRGMRALNVSFRAHEAAV